jgi:hypothetical protein
VFSERARALGRENKAHLAHRRLVGSNGGDVHVGLQIFDREDRLGRGYAAVGDARQLGVS